MATVSVVAFRRSAGDEPGAGRAVGAAYLLSGLIGVATTGLIELIAPLMAEVLGGHSHGGVVTDAVLYLRIAAIGMPALFVALAGNGHLTGLANTRRPLMIALVSNVVNVVLEIVLVYGAHLGIAGSAWGTVIAEVVAAGLFTGASRRAPILPRRPTSMEVGGARPRRGAAHHPHDRARLRIARDDGDRCSSRDGAPRRSPDSHADLGDAGAHP